MYGRRPMTKTTTDNRGKEDGKPVYEKQDGQRFVNQLTTKFNVNTRYTIKVTIRPQLKLLDLVMQAGSLELEEVKKGKDDDEGSISYTSEFDTFGYDLSKREGRTEMPISFKFQGGYNLTVSLQCKFYKEKEVEHCQWGQALTYLDYDCEIKQGSSNIDVLKEKHCDKILS